MFFAFFAERLYRKEQYGIDHIQHLAHFPLRFLTKGNILLNTTFRTVRHILRVITDPLDIIRHMEQGAQTL